MTLFWGVPESVKHRARLDAVQSKGLVAGALFLAILWGTVAAESAAGASGPSDPVAQTGQLEAESIPSPSDSDDEIQLVMALLIAVAVIALLGTFVYWVRTGDSSRRGDEEPSGGAGPQDTLG